MPICRVNPLHLGLIGDRSENVTAHRAIPIALKLAAAALGNVPMETTWLSTDTLDARDADLLQARLLAFGGLWCVPASPYANESGALAAIRIARENQMPFLGTCGGFQHTLLEYARNVLGVAGAAHAESDPGAATPVIHPLACSLVEADDRVFLAENSRLRKIYGRDEAVETYHCRYGLNPAFEKRFEDGHLRFSGRDATGEIRALELAGDAFFVACLFQPERAALRGENHPLIQAYVEAVLRCSPPA